MMQVEIICVGALKEVYFHQACQEYAKRLGRFCQFRITEVREERMPQNPSPRQVTLCLQKEGVEIAKKLVSSAMAVALCVEGSQMDSAEFSRMFSEAAVAGISHIQFVIGSSYGLADEIKASTKFSLSFSKMTFPHQLMRVLLCEQIYRGFMIQNGGKYHK